MHKTQFIHSFNNKKNANAYDNNERKKLVHVLKSQPYAGINAFRLLVWPETAKQILGQLIHIFCNRVIELYICTLYKQKQLLSMLNLLLFLLKPELK